MRLEHLLEKNDNHPLWSTKWYLVLVDSSPKDDILYASATPITLASDHNAPANLDIHCEGVAVDK